MGGGILSSLHGVTLVDGFSGTGDVNGSFKNNGVVIGGNGAETLRFHGAVDGPGSFAGNIEFHNVYSPGASPAAVSFENVTLADSNLLKMEIGGVAKGTGYDAMNVSGVRIWAVH